MTPAEKEIFKILDRNVFVVRKATKEEKGIFSDKKEGGFFTFALESGQKFVACFSEEGKGLRKKRMLTFRPLNRMIKGLKEVSYTLPNLWNFGVTEDAYKFSKGISEGEKEACMAVLRPGRADICESVIDDDPKLLKKALEVSKTYFLGVKAQRKLAKALIQDKVQKSR